MNLKTEMIVPDKVRKKQVSSYRLLKKPPFNNATISLVIRKIPKKFASREAYLAGRVLHNCDSGYYRNIHIKKSRFRTSVASATRKKGWTWFADLFIKVIPGGSTYFYPQ